jgi:Tfp pilus assembly protein PilV
MKHPDEVFMIDVQRSTFEVRGSRFQAPGRAPRAYTFERGALNLNRRKSRGLSLIELIMFIVIVGAAVAGIIAMIGMTTQSSADPMIRKQALAIAEAMLEEVRLQPFTYCDPDDPGAATANLSSGAVSINSIASASADGDNSTLDVPGVNLNGQNAVVLFVGYNNDDNETVSSVVIDPGGPNQTSLGAPLATENNSDDARIYVFGLADPPQGTFTVRVNFNTALEDDRGSNVVVYGLSGVDTAAPFGTPGVDENDDGDGHVTVPSADGELVLAGVAGETTGSSTVDPPAVEDQDISGGSGGTRHHLTTAHQDGAGPNVNFSWNPSSDDHWAAAGISIKPGFGCPTLAETMGPEPGETRYNAVNPFDNVNDYHGFDSDTAVPSGIRTVDGDLIPGLEAYQVTVSVTDDPLGGIGDDAAGNPQSLLIAVTVTGPGNTTVTLNGYRTRYAPNALP